MLRNEFERRDHKIEIPSMSSRPDFAKLNAAIRNWTEKSAKLAGKTYTNDVENINNRKPSIVFGPPCSGRVHNKAHVL